jgi:hypothetical protein
MGKREVLYDTACAVRQNRDYGRKLREFLGSSNNRKCRPPELSESEARIRSKRMNDIVHQHFGRASKVTVS